MDDAKPAADAQLGAVKALVDAINAPPPPPPPPVLSRLDVRAEDTRVVEGDAGDGEAIGFVVSRSGPLDVPCSVAWALGGEAKPGDFVEGAEFAGQLAWDAGDGAEQRIEMVLDPDRVAEGDETATLTLTRPDGATIGQATAQVVIVNDDQPPPVSSKGYDEDLPYGGIMLGAACQDGAPGNQIIRDLPGKRGNALVMYLESRRPIVAIQTENRVDHFPLGATAGGYSDHTVVRDGDRTRRALKGDTGGKVQVVQAPTGGDLRWRVARAVSPEGSTKLELEKDGNGDIRWAGQTRVIKNCARDESWNEEWRRCGGSGDAPPHFAASKNGGAYPTVWFEQPIDPVALGWQIGDRIAYCPVNSAEPESGPRGPNDANLAPPYGKSRYSSVNMSYRARRPLRKSSYPYLAYCGAWWYDLNYDNRYIPILLVGHQRPDGTLLVKGNGYTGYAGAHDFRFGGGRQVRQVIRIPDDRRWAGRRLKGCDGGIWRRVGSTAGSVTLSLRRAGDDVGGADDQGKVLGARAFAAGDLIHGDLKDYSGGGDPHRNVKLDDPVEVQPGEAYYITLTPGDGSAADQFAVGRMLNYLGRGGRGLLKPDHQNDRDRFQTRDGDGPWRTNDEHFGDGNYLTLGLALFFGA